MRAEKRSAGSAAASASKASIARVRSAASHARIASLCRAPAALSAWNAALGGVQDAGVQVTSAEPSSGLIRGNKDGIEVVVAVARQADGSVRVQFDSKGPTQQDPGLADRFSRAYDRRMGR